MVLLDDVVEVLDLADLDPGVMLPVVALDRRSVGATLVDGDLPRNTLQTSGLVGSAVPPCGRVGRSAGSPPWRQPCRPPDTDTSTPP